MPWNNKNTSSITRMKTDQNDFWWATRVQGPQALVRPSTLHSFDRFVLFFYCHPQLESLGESSAPLNLPLPPFPFCSGIKLNNDWNINQGHCNLFGPFSRFLVEMSSSITDVLSLFSSAFVVCPTFLLSYPWWMLLVLIFTIIIYTIYTLTHLYNCYWCYCYCCWCFSVCFIAK